jgi:hypothetical protein
MFFSKRGFNIPNNSSRCDADNFCLVLMSWCLLVL